MKAAIIPLQDRRLANTQATMSLLRASPMASTLPDVSTHPRPARPQASMPLLQGPLQATWLLQAPTWLLRGPLLPTMPPNAPHLLMALPLVLRMGVLDAPLPPLAKQTSCPSLTVL